MQPALSSEQGPDPGHKNLSTEREHPKLLSVLYRFRPVSKFLPVNPSVTYGSFHSPHRVVNALIHKKICEARTVI